MADQTQLLINISQQCLYLLDVDQQVLKQYPVSTSKYGIGNQQGSLQTPLGAHSICEKIGSAAAEYEVFVGRQPIGVLHELRRQQQEIPDDIITSRILRLTGEEPGMNQGGEIDSYQRYIYIHGTDEEERIGQPASHGCIRMRNSDIIELFDLVSEGCRVSIEA